MKKSIACFFIVFSLWSCQESDKKQLARVSPVETSAQNGFENAYFASGCFWCSGVIFENVIGVKEVIVGYSGGNTKNPTYRRVSTGKTGHSETIKVIYNPQKVSFATLVDVYFGSQNATQQNGQGPDIGSQYRSILFYQNEQQKRIIEKKIAELELQYLKPIAAEVLPFQKFWKAEEYHQDYEQKNPDNPYIQSVSVPRFNKFKEKFPELVKDKKDD